MGVPHDSRSWRRRGGPPQKSASQHSARVTLEIKGFGTLLDFHLAVSTSPLQRPGERRARYSEACGVSRLLHFSSNQRLRLHDLLLWELWCPIIRSALLRGTDSFCLVLTDQRALEPRESTERRKHELIHRRLIGAGLKFGSFLHELHTDPLTGEEADQLV